jgi:hypothetical protein
MKNFLKRTGPLMMLLLLMMDLLMAQPDTAWGKDTNNLIDFTLFPSQDPFHSDRIIKISLKFDMRKFVRTKYKGEYQPAELVIYNLDNDTVRKEIRVRARGQMRRSHCHFPPIKLNLKKTAFENESLNDFKSLKLVTHCKNSDTYEQYILKEFLVYRMFNILTDSSFRVRLVQIDYVDSEARKKPLTKYGFIIESNDHLAARLGGVRIDREGINTWDTDRYHTNLMAVFQYMIGHTDWSIPPLHNVKLVKPSKPLSHILAIPYDFDYSGMVNTVYAVPDERLGTESVLTRVYRGYCLPSEDHYQRLFDVFIKKKQEMFSLIEDFELLHKKSRLEMLDYLEEFYHIIETPWLARREIIDTCRPLPGRR